MAPNPPVRSLYEDWQLRRERLLSVPLSAPGAYIDVQVRVLDYLLDRYKNAPEAQRPSRFYLKTEPWLNRRAIVVHHHLGKDRAGGANTDSDAQRRVSAIVKRLTDHEHDEAPVEPRVLSRRTWETITDSFRSHGSSGESKSRGMLRLAIRMGTAHDVIERWLHSGPEVAKSVLEYLYECLSDRLKEDLRAVDLLGRCKGGLSYAVLAWRRRIEAGGTDRVTEALRTVFERADPREVGDRIRELLVCESPNVRLEAISVLGEIGSLDDIGLLSDLLALPMSDDDSVERIEREEVSRAMQKLAQHESDE